MTVYRALQKLRSNEDKPA